MSTTDTQPAEVTELLAKIAAGDFDEHLRSIEAHAKHRAKIVAQRAALTLEAGTRVRLTDRISPKYLAGNTGTVVEVTGGGRKKTRLRVRLDPQYRDRAARFVDFEGCIEGTPTVFEAVA